MFALLRLLAVDIWFHWKGEMYLYVVILSLFLVLLLGDQFALVAMMSIVEFVDEQSLLSSKR